MSVETQSHEEKFQSTTSGVEYQVEESDGISDEEATAGDPGSDPGSVDG